MLRSMLAILVLLAVTGCAAVWPRGPGAPTTLSPPPLPAGPSYVDRAEAESQCAAVQRRVEAFNGPAGELRFRCV